jgi:hypothetical protein
MEILWWLVPPVVVTVVAMAWVSWIGRESRGEGDRDEAVARMAKALEPGERRRFTRARPEVKVAIEPRPRERSTGIAVRPSQAGHQGAASPVAGTGSESRTRRSA